MADDERETYRFDPTGATGEDDSEDRAESEVHDPPRGTDREFDWRGWTLVGMLVLAFGVIPLTIFFIPRAGNLLAATGLSYRDAFLVLPLLPALLLGLMAVWATTRP